MKTEIKTDQDTQFADDQALLAVLAQGKAGDQRSLAIIVKRYKRLVYKIAAERRWGIAKADRRDLVQDGLIGLVLAVEHFDPSKHGPFFARYAAPWIRGEVVKSAENMRSLVQRKSAANNGKTRFDISADDLPDSLFADEWNPESLCIAKEAMEADVKRVQQAVAKLTEDERELVKARWLTEDPVPLKVLAAHRGVSETRIRQLVNRAIKNLIALIERRQGKRSFRLRLERRALPAARMHRAGRTYAPRTHAVR